jgi:hypothetical protein
MTHGDRTAGPIAARIISYPKRAIKNLIASSVAPLSKSLGSPQAPALGWKSCRGLLLREEREQDLPLLADEADEAVRLVPLLALDVGIVHHDHLDLGVLHLRRRLGNGQRLRIEGQVLN